MVKRNKLMFVISCCFMSMIALLCVYTLLAATGCIDYRSHEITITSGSSERSYDGTDLVYEKYEVDGDLGFGAVIDINFTGKQKNAGQSENTFFATIRDQNGVDISENYKIKMVYGVLKVNPITIGIEAKSAQKIYDGQPLTANEFKIIQGSTVNGDRVEAIVSGEITEVGETENKVFAKVLDVNGNDVSSNYNLEIQNGTLSIIASKLTIKTTSKSKPYDGEPLESTQEDWEMSGNLLFNHTAQMIFKKTITNVGTIQNDGVILITDQNGNDVTNLYEIEYNPGTLRVEPAKLEVVTGSIDAIYDGNSFFNNSIPTITSGTLYNGDYLKVVNYSNFVNAGKHSNYLTLKVFNSEDKDVTSNYIIEQTNGIIDIQKRQIKFYISNNLNQKVYDGNLLSKNDILLQLDSEFNSLVDGHTFDYTLKNIVDVKDYSNYNDIISTIKIYADDEKLIDVTKNYLWEIEMIDKISIIARDVEITVMGGSKVFDFKPYYPSENDYYLSGNSLDDDTLRNYLFKIDTTSKNNMIKAGYYNASENIKFRVYFEDKDVTKNFNIIVKDDVMNNVLIEKYNISIETDGGEKEFNGSSLSVNTFKIISGEQFLTSNNTKISIKENKDVIYVKENEQLNIPEKISIIKDSIDYSESFNIEWKYGILTILPKKIQVETPNLEVEFDTKQHFTTNPADLILSDSLKKFFNDNKYKITCQIKPSSGFNFENIFVGSYSNEVLITIKTIQGKDISNSFEIEYKYGKVEILKGKAYLNLKNNTTFTYEYSFQNINFDAKNFILTKNLDDKTSMSNVTFEISSNGYYFDKVGVYQIDILPEKIYFNSIDITNMLDVEAASVNVTINKRKLTIEGKDITFVYNGGLQGFSDDNYKKNIKFLGDAQFTNYLLNNNLYYLDKRTKAINVGAYQNEFTLRFTYNNQDITDNLEINYQYGYLYIEPKTVTFSLQKKVINYEYDGNPHYYPKENIQYTFKDVTLFDIYTFDFSFDNKSYTEVGEYEFKIKITPLLEEEETPNYKSSYLDAKLVITKTKNKLTVYPKRYVIHSNNLEGDILDASTIVNHNLVIYGEIGVQNYYYDVTFKGIASLNNPGKISVATFILYDEFGNDITDNYDITFLDNDLIIANFKVTITTDSLTKEYDGKDLKATLENIHVSFDQLAVELGIRYEIVKTTSINKPGITKNQVELKFLFDGEDITNQFEIKNEFGNLTITKRIVSLVIAKDGSVRVDGLLPEDNLEDNYFILEENGEIKGLVFINALLNKNYEINDTIIYE